MDMNGQIVKSMIDYSLKDSDNRLNDGAFIYDPPLVGFADATEPLFKKMQEESIIGPVFRPPLDWLPEAKTVISYFLPFSEKVRTSHYSGKTPSENWMHGRFKGELFNDNMRRFLIQILTREGHRALSPVLEKEFWRDGFAGSSNWSERHIAYAAGLGSFGLSRGLITAKGKAGRFGSIITDLVLPFTPRQHQEHHYNCPYYKDQSCGACISRCPAGVITADGMDKVACKHYINSLDPHTAAVRNKFGYAYSACGKCQVDVPCETCIP